MNGLKTTIEEVKIISQLFLSSIEKAMDVLYKYKVDFSNEC